METIHVLFTDESIGFARRGLGVCMIQAFMQIFGKMKKLIIFVMLSSLIYEVQKNPKSQWRNKWLDNKDLH